MRTQKVQSQVEICSEGVFHSFNRTNNKELLFKKEQHYIMFLQTIKEFLAPFVRFLAHNLIPNHFHFAYQVRTINEMEAVINTIKPRKHCKKMIAFLAADDKEIRVDWLITNQWRKAFISYAKKVNFKINRKGNLFNQNFETTAAHTETDIRQLIRYINFNTVKHDMDVDPMVYNWSSFSDYFKRIDNESLIDVELGLQYFDHIDEFIEYHFEFGHLYKRYKQHQQEIKRLKAQLFIR